MNYSIIRRILGIVVEFIGAFLLLPAICGLFYGEKQVIVYFVLAFVYFIAGRLIASIKLTNHAYYAREGLVVVGLSWIVLSILGAIPLVITGQNFRGLPCVFHDDFNAVRELTALMIRKGAKRIVYIGVLEEDKAAGLARREGCQEALRSAGFDADNMPRRIADFEAQSGYRAMLELLAENPDLDGVICTPTLTTAMLHQKRCGLEAAKLLLRLIEEEENKSGSKEDAPHKSIRLGYRIIERDSLRTETLKKQEGEE